MNSSLKQLKLMSWNVTGMTTGIPYLVRELNNKHITVCGISEHWLLKQNVHILNNIDTNYQAHVIPCENPRTFNGREYGRGGVAILWHTSINKFVQTVSTDSDRIAAIKIALPFTNIYVIQVYLPSSNEHINTFKSEVDKLHDLISTFDTDSISIVMGDFNAYFHCTGSGVRYRDAYLASFAQNHSMHAITGTDMCGGNKFSFIPGLNMAPSLIDHILVNERCRSTVKSCYIGSDSPLNVSRHLPLYMTLDIDVRQSFDFSDPRISSYNKRYYNWNSAERTSNYSKTLTESLDANQLNYENLNETCDTIIKCICSAADTHVPKRTFKTYLKPYWSQAIKQFHKLNRAARSAWINAGRPRSGVIYDEYKRLKGDFRRALRKAADEYERNEYEEMDRLAEVDQGAFWKTVNSRKKNKNRHACEIEFDGKLERDPECVLNGWHQYFTNLYSFAHHDDFDDNFMSKIDEDVNSFLQINSVSKLTEPISTNELDAIVTSMPNGKSGSHDDVTYEHIKHGGNKLINCITAMFNSILLTETIPASFKQSVTITLHKGSGKSTIDPNNYRAITLLPVLSKLFEKIMLCRMEKIGIPAKLHPLQHGFKKGKSCKMASFLYQEASNYCYERNDVTHTCFLDAMKAFDMTWIRGVLYKLHHLGVQGKALRIVSGMLSGASSRVVAYGHLSPPFAIEQGTRQGSTWSPFFYTVLIDELLVQLTNSQNGLTINNIPVCAPTQADDIVLISLSKNGLSKLISTCIAYANKWRYRYNIGKCAVLSHDNKRCRPQDQPSIQFDHVTIARVDHYKHLGITQCRSAKTPANVDDIRQLARGTLFSFINAGIHRNGLNPITCAKIYISTVLPRAFFGCELWNSISNSDMRQLEATHHFCLKRIQGLPRLTRSDMVKGLLGFTSIEAYIDLQKLLFLGTLCRLEPCDIAYQILINRLYQYTSNSTMRNRGFVPDVTRILGKYQLYEHLNNFMSSNVFPSKQQWKRICKQRVYDHEQTAWFRRMCSCDDFSRFREIHYNLVPSNIWRIALDNPNSLNNMNLLAKICCQQVGKSTKCNKCDVDTNDVIYHTAFECETIPTEEYKTTYMTKIQLFNNDLYLILILTPNDTLLKYLLGFADPVIMNILKPEEFPKFMNINALYLKNLFT